MNRKPNRKSQLYWDFLLGMLNCFRDFNSNPYTRTQIVNETFRYRVTVVASSYVCAVKNSAVLFAALLASNGSGGDSGDKTKEGNGEIKAPDFQDIIRANFLGLIGNKEVVETQALEKATGITPKQVKLYILI